MKEQNYKEEQLLEEEMNRLQKTLQELSDHLPKDEKSDQILEQIRSSIEEWKEHLPNE